MKLNKDFVLRQIADTWVVLPLGDAAVELNGMLTLNGSGVLLWKALEQGADMGTLVTVLTSEYDVSKEEAQADIKEFLDVLSRAGCLG